MTYKDAWDYNGLKLISLPGESVKEYQLVDRSGNVSAKAFYYFDTNLIPARVRYWGDTNLAKGIDRYLYLNPDNVCPYCLTESWSDEHNCCRACSCQ
jgi:hypothetical protein